MCIYQINMFFYVHVSCVICIDIYIYVCIYVHYVHVLNSGQAGRSISLPNHTLCIPCKMCMYVLCMFITLHLFHVYVSCVICIDIYIYIYICVCILCLCIMIWAGWSKYKSPKSYPMYTLQNVYIYMCMLYVYLSN